MTLTAHPDKDELMLFGGEHFDGNKVGFLVLCSQIKLPEHAK